MKAIRLSIIGAVLLLAGCVAAALVSTAAGVIVYDGRGLRMIERDARIFYLVNSSIANDPRFRSSHIVVTSFNQIVLLAGQTPAASLKVLAEKIAVRTPHVSRVYNQMTIGQPTSFTVRAKDAWITSELRSQMLARKGLESGSIRVVTEAGIVYLMGIVSREQANIAVEVARQIHGVARVVKVFQYVN